MTDSLGFLLTDAARLLRRRFDEQARSIGVTRAQWRVLTALSRREGQTQHALADLLEVEPITLCRMIDRLEEAGRVERRRSPSDRRAWNIYLTDSARPLIDRLRAIGEEVVEQGLGGLDAAERERFTAALSRMRDNLSSNSSRTTANG